MSYTFLSFLPNSAKHKNQWSGRSVALEVRSCADRTLEKVFMRHLVPAAARVLEAGCGLGGWVSFLTQKKIEMVGLEFEDPVIKTAKRSAPDLPLIRGDVTHLPFPDNSYDAYISLGVIEHFQNGPQLALAEARRIVKPGGLAFISVPLLNPLRKVFIHPVRNVIMKTAGILGKRPAFWEYRLTEKELRLIVENAGFEIIESGVDDYEAGERARHIGLHTDFFFLRGQRESWRLNWVGRILLELMRIFPASFFGSGIYLVARNRKDVGI